MYTSMIHAVSGMRAAQVKIDSIGNNVANTNTYGYKSQEVSFGSILADQMTVQPEAPNEMGRLTPPQLRVGYGTLANLTRLNVQPGPPTPTEVDTDFYLQGNGFFGVQAEDGQLRLTRSGAFQMINQGDGQMVLGTAEGFRVLNTDGRPIEIPDGYRLQVAENGAISFINQANSNDVMENAMSMAIYQVPNRQILNREGENLYSLPVGMEPALDETSLVKQGFLEGSNVDLQKEMVALIEMQRTFQFNSRALSYIDQMGSTINNIYGR